MRFCKPSKSGGSRHPACAVHDGRSSGSGGKGRTADWLVGCEHSSARPNGVAHGFRSNPDLHVWRGDWFGPFDH